MVEMSPVEPYAILFYFVFLLIWGEIRKGPSPFGPTEAVIAGIPKTGSQILAPLWELCFACPLKPLNQSLDLGGDLFVAIRMERGGFTSVTSSTQAHL